jgi:integrase
VSDTSSTEEKPKVYKRLYLTPDEANRLIDAVGRRGRHPFRDKIMVRMTYRHGLRAREAVGMVWDQINLDQGTLYVRRAKMGKDSTHSLDRDELRDLRKLHRLRTGPWVFESERGGPLSVDAIQRLVRDAGEAINLPFPAHPHQLRHAAGYYLTNADTDMRLVQDFLGHKTANMTMHYSQTSPQRLAALRVR